MTDVTMPFEAVRRHAGNVDTIADAVDRGRDAATQVHLGTHAYGQLCQFLPALLAPVENASIAALSATVEALRETTGKLRTAATGSQTTDTGNATTITSSHRPMMHLPL